LAFKNRLIQWLVRFKQKGSGFKEHFLIVSTTGFGDTLWATPALRALKQNFPESYVGVLTSPLGREVLKNNPHVDEFFVLKKPHFFSLVSIYFALKKRHIGQILVFHASQRMVFALCAFLNPAALIGTRGLNKSLDALFTKTLDHGSIHEIERRLKIVEETGAISLDPLLEFPLQREDEEKASHFLSENQIPSYLPLIGLHPGSKDAFKRWPEEHFVEVGNRLKQHTGCQILVTGDQAEKSLVESIASKIEGAIPIVGKLEVGTLAGLFRKLSLLITNDTGPMHLAFALNTPTIALFSPTDPRLCGPYKAKKNIVISKKPTCRPCLRKKCRDAFCLLQISPQEVYDSALTLFYPT
jgi:ADP-heptose:LPS heptosyltransferase